MYAYVPEKGSETFLENAPRTTPRDCHAPRMLGRLLVTWFPGWGVASLVRGHSFAQYQSSLDGGWFESELLSSPRQGRGIYTVVNQIVPRSLYLHAFEAVTHKSRVPLWGHGPCASFQRVLLQ